MDDLIHFSDGAFEIALCTFNRVEFIIKQIKVLYKECLKRNIKLRVVDASEDDKTEDFIEVFNADRKIKVGYTRVSSGTLPGYMQIEAIKTAQSEYVWVYADSRIFDFSEFDSKVFPQVIEGADVIVFYDSEFPKEGTLYSNASDFIQDCFVPFTCTGCSIYKRDIFKCFNDSLLLKKCDDLYKKNYAFSWMGYVLFALDWNSSNYQYYAKVQIEPVEKKKKSTWTKRFYHCWIDDIIDLTASLPDSYKHTDLIIRNVWERLRLDDPYYCFISRTKGDLNQYTYKNYLRNGKLVKTGANIKRIGLYACAPLLLVYIYYQMTRVVHWIDRMMRKGLKWK